MVFAMVDKHLKHFCETYVNENNARFRIQNKIHSIFPFLESYGHVIYAYFKKRLAILFLETTLRKPSIYFSPRLTTALNFINFSLFAISLIESLYHMLTLSVVSSVLSYSQPSCCHRGKMVSIFHFLLQRKEVWLC